MATVTGKVKFFNEAKGLRFHRARARRWRIRSLLCYPISTVSKP